MTYFFFSSVPKQKNRCSWSLLSYFTRILRRPPGDKGEILFLLHSQAKGFALSLTNAFTSPFMKDIEHWKSFCYDTFFTAFPSILISCLYNVEGFTSFSSRYTYNHKPRCEMQKQKKSKHGLLYFVFMCHKKKKLKSLHITFPPPKKTNKKNQDCTS